jgi:HD-GYP domain-containing protein (c-di-GMP phosphodiesterase class II)
MMPMPPWGRCTWVVRDLIRSHALYGALLSELVIGRMGLAEHNRHPVMAAALTTNVGLLDLQAQLLNHQGPLNEEKWLEIKLHPERSVALLRAAGVDDEGWLTIIDLHHEKMDGSGYGRGLAGPAINRESRIVAVTDRYHALISDRESRSGLSPTAALRKIFSQRDEGLDEDIVRVLIKQIGVYPPGVHVRLFNGEIGLVIRRGKDGTSPRVTSIISPRGAPYIKPFVRDCSKDEYAIKEMVNRPKVSQ